MTDVDEGCAETVATVLDQSSRTARAFRLDVASATQVAAAFAESPTRSVSQVLS